jgi:zinc transport system ATP-binding protein
MCTLSRTNRVEMDQRLTHQHAHHGHKHGRDHHDHAHGASMDGCDAPAVSPDPDPTALISARGLYFHRAGRDLIAGVDLDVRPGEIVTVIGPNGAGKSTLVKLMLGIEAPDRGKVLRPVTTRVGYVPQIFSVDRAIPMTALGFLMLGSKAAVAEAHKALTETGAERTANSQLAALSGGETQRVLIARALLRNPNLLVLDEPVSGVDYAGEADLYQLIGNLKDSHNLGVLLVSHDLHVVMARSDRVLCLNGHICCSGRPEAVAQSAEYVRLFGPEAAKALALYHHHHDHRHDLSGTPHPAPESVPSHAKGPE